MNGLYSIYRTRPRNGKVEHQRAGRILVRDGSPVVLEDHHGRFLRDLVADPGRFPARMARLRASSHYEVRSWDPHLGDGSLAELPQAELQPLPVESGGPQALPPAVFDYHRAGMDRPHLLEARDGAVTLDGKVLEAHEHAKVLENVRAGAAILRYRAQALGKAELEYRAVSPDKNLVGEPGYLYHATNEENAHGIAAGQMDLHKPWEHTDQSCWPDGSTEKRSGYFVSHDRTGHIDSFVPEFGRGVTLRVRQDAHPFKVESGTKDIYSRRPISSDKFEIHTTGGWLPLRQWAGASLGKSEENSDVDQGPAPDLTHDPMVPKLGNLHALTNREPKAGEVATAFDLNDFSRVNDEVGWREGDEAIQAYGGLVAKVGGAGGSYRDGGDSFVVFHANLDEQVLFLREMQEAASELPPVGGKLRMTAAFGTGPTVHHAREAVQRAKADKYGADGRTRDSVSA